MQLNYAIRKDRQLDHMVVATLPGDAGYTIFKHGTLEACRDYIDALTPEIEAQNTKEQAMIENYEIVARFEGGRTVEVVTTHAAYGWIAAADSVFIMFRWNNTIRSVAVTKKSARDFLARLDGNVEVRYNHNLHVLTICDVYC